DVLERTATDLRSWVDPSDRDNAVALLDRRGSFSNIETRFLRGDGKIFEALVSAVRIIIDGEICAIWTWRDVSDMRAAESRAQQSERKYAALFAVNPEPVLVSRVSD